MPLSINYTRLSFPLSIRSGTWATYFEHVLTWIQQHITDCTNSRIHFVPHILVNLLYSQSQSPAREYSAQTKSRDLQLSLGDWTWSESIGKVFPWAETSSLLTGPIHGIQFYSQAQTDCMRYTCKSCFWTSLGIRNYLQICNLEALSQDDNLNGWQGQPLQCCCLAFDSSHVLSLDLFLPTTFS